jgi:hypothetical protein
LHRRANPPLRPLERQLVEALSDALDAEAQSLLSKQMAQVNLVQRHAEDKEVNLYRMERGKPSFEEAARFAGTVSEAEVARISFQVPNVAGTFRASFWTVNGFLFSIQFSRSPKGIKNATAEIREVELLLDPMAAPPAGRAPAVREALRGWLREWASEWQVSGLAEPLPEAERQDLVTRIGAELPPDYLEVVAQTEGLKVDGWTIHGLSGVRSVALPDANCHVLAEHEEKGVLCVREGEQQVRLYFYGNEGAQEELGASFRQAIERLMRL